MHSTVKVSVITITYNHEKYIREALESFVSQTTTFPFEVIVADDCSSDKTPQIISEYAKKYPNIIKPVLRKKNIGAIANSIDSLRRATGEYVALCEGDDFWTDPKKLQTQATQLDENPQYALSFHKVRVFYENGLTKETLFPAESNPRLFTFKNLIKENFIQTNSVMYRRQDYSKIPDNILPLDWYLHLYHASYGKIGFINRVMSAYRRHEEGLWWNSADEFKKWEKHGSKILNLFLEIDKMYGQNKNYSAVTVDHVVDVFNKLIECDTRFNTSIIDNIINTQAEILPQILSIQHKYIKTLHKEVSKLRGNVRDQKWLISHKEEELQSVVSELSELKQLKYIKFRDKYHRLTGTGKPPRNL